MELQPQKINAHGVRIERTYQQPQRDSQNRDDDKDNPVQADSALGVINALAQCLARFEVRYMFAG